MAQQDVQLIAAPRLSGFRHQIVQGQEVDAMALLQSLDRQDVLAGGDEPERGQFLDRAPRHLRLRGVLTSHNEANRNGNLPDAMWQRQ